MASTSAPETVSHLWAPGCSDCILRFWPCRAASLKGSQFLEEEASFDDRAADVVNVLAVASGVGAYQLESVGRGR